MRTYAYLHWNYIINERVRQHGPYNHGRDLGFFFRPRQIESLPPMFNSIGEGRRKINIKINAMKEVQDVYYYNRHYKPEFEKLWKNTTTTTITINQIQMSELFLVQNRSTNNWIHSAQSKSAVPKLYCGQPCAYTLQSLRRVGFPDDFSRYPSARRTAAKLRMTCTCRNSLYLKML